VGTLWVLSHSSVVCSEVCSVQCAVCSVQCAVCAVCAICAQPTHLSLISPHTDCNMHTSHTLHNKIPFSISTSLFFFPPLDSTAHPFSFFLSLQLLFFSHFSLFSSPSFSSHLFLLTPLSLSLSLSSHFSLSHTSPSHSHTAMPSRRKKSKLLSDHPLAAVSSTQRALCILEILEHILSFLSQHLLRNVTSLVSRRWYNATRRFLSTEAFWASNFHNEKRLDAMNAFSNTQIITLTPDAPERRSLPYTWPIPGPAQRQVAWREVLIRLQNASANKQLERVRVLDLRGVLDPRVFCRVVEQCLAQQLVILKLESFKQGDYFYLDRILKACPKLQVLTVEPLSDVVHTLAIPGSSPDDPGSEHDSEALAVLRERQMIEPLDWPEKLELRTLDLYRPMLSQRVIQAILRVCPELRVLKLVSLTERAPASVGPALHDSAQYDLDAFVSHIARSCPRLDTFHLSLQSRKMSTQTLNTILESLPNVRHWSFVARDVCASSMLPLLYNKVALGGRLTSLELKGAGFTDLDRSTSTLSKALHEFLCTTPTLLHLIAPTVTYYTEYLDLNRILVGSKDSHPDTPRADGRFWVCRSLKTLHLEIRARYESDTLQHSRVIFGYLSKVCPKLEDLQLRRPYLSFWLAGGLCLLSRLHNMERVKLCCRSYTEFQGSDVFEWMRKEGNPWGRVSPNRIAVSSSLADTARLGFRMAMIKAGFTTAPLSIHLTPSATGPLYSSLSPCPTSMSSSSSSTLSSSDSGTRELSFADFASLGEMKDIEDLQIERMLQYQRRQPCWPRLESFTIVHDGWFNNTTTSGIERLRPDVRFRFDTQSFHQLGYP